MRSLVSHPAAPNKRWTRHQQQKQQMQWLGQHTVVPLSIHLHQRMQKRGKMCKLVAPRAGALHGVWADPWHDFLLATLKICPVKALSAIQQNRDTQHAISTHRSSQDSCNSMSTSSSNGISTTVTIVIITIMVRTLSSWVCARQVLSCVAAALQEAFTAETTAVALVLADLHAGLYRLPVQQSRPAQLPQSPPWPHMPGPAHCGLQRCTAEPARSFWRRHTRCHCWPSQPLMPLQHSRPVPLDRLPASQHAHKSRPYHFRLYRNKLAL